MADDFVIAIPVYDGVDLVDIAAPYEIFGWLATNWNERKVQVFIVA
jgi:cyclohexyl-isocyanide hydratase